MPIYSVTVNAFNQTVTDQVVADTYAEAIRIMRDRYYIRINAKLVSR
jgi:hypothetical protein